MSSESEHATVTPEMIEKARKKIGEEWRPPQPYFNVQATKDTIRHFVDGYGDINPLYRDAEYAAKTGSRVPCTIRSITRRVSSFRSTLGPSSPSPSMRPSGRVA